MFSKKYIIDFIEEHKLDRDTNHNAKALANPADAHKHRLIAAVYAATELENCRSFCDSTDGQPAYEGFIDLAKELTELHAWLAENK